MEDASGTDAVTPRAKATAAPPTAQETAVLGSEGRLQLATVVSMATLAAPLSPSTGTTLSAQYAKHDSKSTHVLDCCAKRPALGPKESWWHTAERIGRSADHGQQVGETLARSS